MFASLKTLSLLKKKKKKKKKKLSGFLLSADKNMMQIWHFHEWYGTSLERVF
jgi:hypothetical protein